MTKAQKEAEAAEARATLRQWVKPGDTVYTVLRKVSSSGMSRVIDCKVISRDSVEAEPRIFHIGYNVAKLLGYKWDSKHEGMRVGGCGMDMGFHVVYSLGSALYRGEGFQCTEPAKHCPHNSHVNEDTPRDGSLFHDGDAGYSLNHAWI